MFFVRDEVWMFSIPLPFDLTDNQSGVPKYNQRFDSQVYGSLETKDASFIFGHVDGAVKAKSGGERSMATFWRDEYCADTVAKCIGGTIKVQGPSGSLFRSFIWSEIFNIVQCHDVFVREVKLHGLVIFYSLMSQMVS